MTASPDVTNTFRKTLDNGLTIIVRPQHDAPIGSFWVWYRVGGRNEVSGITGISHWAEHMQFKGTQEIGKGEIFKSITANGGTLNGFTWLDYTAYFETLPIDRIQVAIDIESDRMANSRFDADEVASERTVIISERQGNENNPGFLLSEEVMAAAFKAHPYGNGVIGHMSDLRTITRDDLYGHYRRYYVPNNAVVVFAGALDPSEAFARIEHAFGSIPRGDDIPDVRTVEPQQYGERRVDVNRPAPNQVIQMVHHAPEASHADVPAMIVLDAVMSGGKPMGFGGGASMGRSSRLYRALVMTELASSAGSSFTLSIDPYLFNISATLLPDSSRERVESAIVSEIERLQREQVSEAELARVMKQIRAQYVYSQQSVSSKAYMLGSLAMAAPERTPESLMEDILAVTAADIQRVAQTWLTPDNRTVGWLNPMSPSHDPALAGLTSPAGYVPDAADLGLDATMPAVRETRLNNGLRVATLETAARVDETPVVLRLRIPGGAAIDGKHPGVARFTGDMLTRGSGGRSVDDLAEELDGLGASISVGTGRESTDIVATSLREDAGRVASLMATALFAPDFPEQQVEIVRGQILSGLRQVKNDTRSEAEHLLRSMLYPAGHPYRGRVSGTEESVESISRADLLAFRERAYLPSRAIAAVGGMQHNDAVDLVRSMFEGWTGDTPELEIPRTAPLSGSIREDGEIAGKSQADIALGTPALSRADPDYYALSVANLIFGRLGLMGRIGESVRERQGMAYYAFSSLEAGLGTGFWSARAGVNPANIERALATTLEELRLYLAEGPSEREFTDAVSYLTGSLPLGLETVGSVTQIVADIVFHDLGDDYLQRYRKIIRSLSAEQLIETMGKYIDPKRLAIAVVKPEGA